MKPIEIAQGITRAVVYLCLIALGLYGLFLLQSLIVYCLIAAVISLMGRPIMRFLQKRLKVQNTMAVIITMSFFFLIIFGLFSLFIPLVIQQGQNLSLLDVNQLDLKLNQLLQEITAYFQIDPKVIQSWMVDQNLMNSLNLVAIPEFLNTLLGWLSGLTIGLFSILFISFFLLKDAKLLERSVLVFFDPSAHNRLTKAFKEIKNLLSRYFIGLLAQISILVIIYSLVLFIFGVQNALVIALLCALLNLIPYIGPLIGGVLMLVLTMTANLDADFSTVILPKTIYVMIGFTLGQLVDNFFSQPLIFSTSVKSHPLEIFIVVLSAGVLFGTVGLIVAIPTYTALKVIFKTFFAENRIVKSLTKDI